MSRPAPPSRASRRALPSALGRPGFAAAWFAPAAAALTGVAAGCAAEALRATSGALSALGGSAAIWVAAGFVFVLAAARRRTGPDRLPWMCVTAAVYLYGWLLAYHLLYVAVEHAPFATAWAESRLWVAAVAPACVALGCVAVGSLRSGLAGDICVALPLGWSIPEAVGAVHNGWHYVLLFTVPTMVVAAVPLALVRRRLRPVAVVTAALVSGAAFMAVLPLATRLLERLG